MKKTVILSALLSVGALGLVGGFAARRLTQDAVASSGGVSALHVARLEDRLTALEGRLESLDRLSADVETLKRGRVPPGTDVEPPAEPEAPEEDGAPTAAFATEGDIQPTKLERWLEGQGMQGEFEDLVSKVYEQARNRRMARERAEHEERAREMEALSEGPYGKFNYRVNSLAKKLTLDSKQQEYLYNLLLKYDERRSQEIDQLGRLEGDVTPERVKEHSQQTMLVHQELAQQFENDLLAGLNPDQREAYGELPEHERGTGSFDKLSFFTVETGAGIAGMKTNVRIALPVAPVPRPAAPPSPAPRK